MAGGFLDAAGGGGGWSPVVTSNLLVQGSEPRRTIGTVNSTEFLLTASISATFVGALGWAAFTTTTVGFLLGGVLAAPRGAIIAKLATPCTLLRLVGCLLVLTNLFGVYTSLHR